VKRGEVGTGVQSGDKREEIQLRVVENTWWKEDSIHNCRITTLGTNHRTRRGGGEKSNNGGGGVWVERDAACR
jgi:hypothetical protein